MNSGYAPIGPFAYSTGVFSTLNLPLTSVLQERSYSVAIATFAVIHFECTISIYTQMHVRKNSRNALVTRMLYSHSHERK